MKIIFKHDENTSLKHELWKCVNISFKNNNENMKKYQFETLII